MEELSKCLRNHFYDTAPAQFMMIRLLRIEKTEELHHPVLFRHCTAHRSRLQMQQHITVELLRP